MNNWEPVIGLEIHVQLKTRTKMFCRCETGFGFPENTRTCPVCLGHPGALPVTNRRAVEWTVKLGLALGCTIAERAVFSRKHYFYPDLPKGYQISQYDEPLCLAGSFTVPGEDGEHVVGIVRAHLEEDAARSVHLEGASGRIVGATRTLVDYNRGGTPLVEIVTQPDIHSAEQAKSFLELLRQTIVELGISDAEMEKGTLRCDANISVREPGGPLRTRTELKNMNSFRYIARGIEAEVKRQIEVYEAGGQVVQETRDYDPATDSLSLHRTKEEAEDYRYFPEPDLVPVEPEAELIERLRGELPELPGRRIERLAEELDFYTATVLVTGGLDRLYAAVPGDRRAVANVLTNQFAAAGVDPAAVDAGELAKLIEARDRIPRATFTEALAATGEPGFSAEKYLAEETVGDAESLGPVVEAVLAANPNEVEAYRGGKQALLGFFVGQVMKETGGKADPKAVNELLRQKLTA